MTEGDGHGDRYGDPTRSAAPPGSEETERSAPDEQDEYRQATGEPSYGHASYGQASYGQASYGQASYGQASHGQASYGQEPGQLQSWQQPGQGPYPSAPPYGQAGQQYGQQYPPTAHQPDPYAQNPYGQYPQSPYPQAPWAGPPGFTRPPVQLGSWGSRAVALLLDVLFAILMYLPGIIVLIVAFATADATTELDGTTTITNINGSLVALGVALCLVALCWQIWNQGWRPGAQGWSWGKQILGLKLVREATLQPPGGWIGIARMLLRGFLGNITGGIYTVLTCLWPLWDEKKQTLDDKILSTLVIRVP
jgi:uncharacterized RDD family membrane protein YckC